MNEKGNLRLGPGAPSLILMFVVLALSVLTVLTYLNSRTDLKLGERSLVTAEAVYALKEKAQERAAFLDELLLSCREEAEGEAEYQEAIERRLPEEMELWEGEISWTEEDGVRTLYCTVRVLPRNGEERFTWTCHEILAGSPEEW